jgi:transcription antitermination factor NusG
MLCFLSPDFGIFTVSEEERIRLEKARKNIKSPIGAIVEIVRGQYKGTIGKISEINYPNLYIVPENFFYLEKKPLINVTINQVILRDSAALFKTGTPVAIIRGEYAGLKGVIERTNYPYIMVISDVFGREILIKSHISNVEVISC